MNSVKILENGDLLATLTVKSGQVVADTPIGDYVIDQMKHGHKREDGEKLLHAVVAYLDSSTMLAAVPSDEDEPDPEDFWTSTEPSEVNNPDDHWPDHGEQNPAEKHHIPDTEHDYR